MLAFCFRRIWLQGVLLPHTRVVALSKAAKQASRTGRANHTSVLLLSEVWPCGSCALVCSLDVYLHHQVPVLVFHVLEADVAQDAGIVDEDVNPAERLDGGLDNPVAILDRVVVGYGLAACRSDLVDDGVSGLEEARCQWKISKAINGEEPTLVPPPSPLNEPPKSLTTTLAPREAKKRAYARPSPPPAPVTTTVWPS